MIRSSPGNANKKASWRWITWERKLNWEPLAIGPDFQIIEGGHFVIERPHATDHASIGRLMKIVREGRDKYGEYALIYDEKEYMYYLVRMDKW